MELEQQRQSGPGAETPPVLGILNLEMSVNCSDGELLSNLEASRKRNLPKLRLDAMVRERPLVICGSGPSLAWNFKKIPENADVMALNGAYKFLRAAGVKPNYFAMLDARPANTNFLEGVEGDDALFLFASQVHPDVFEKARGLRAGVFHLASATTQKVFPDEELYVGGGGTIGLTALGIALALGYRHVILMGYDSSFVGPHRHVQFQSQNQVEEEFSVWVKDRQYRTTKAMAAQAMDFFPFYAAIQKTCPEFVIEVAGSGLFYDFIVTNNNPSTRERELAKYHDAYKEDSYGMSKGRYGALNELLGQVSGESYLDVSTGRGEALHLAREHGFQLVRGTETVEQLLGPDVTFAILPNLPMDSGSYDVVSLIEVIEHLVPEDVVPTLYELTRVAKKTVLISAATQAHWMGGVNLHPSARPAEEWDKLFHEVWGDKVQRAGSLGFSPVWRVDL